MTLLRKVHHLDPQSYTAHPQRSTVHLMRTPQSELAKTKRSYWLSDLF